MTFIQKYLINKSSNLYIQLLRYFFVGGVAAIFDIGGLYILSRILGMNHLIAAPISYLVGLAINYLLSILWVFKVRHKNISTELSVFLMTGVVGLLLNQLILWVLVDLVDVDLMISKVISVSIVFFWHFFSRKLSLFK